MHNGLHPIRQEPLGIALFGDIGAMHIPLVALPRIERQRLHRPDAVDRLDEERAAPRLGRHDRADAPPDRRQHRDKPAADQQGQDQDTDRHYRAEEEHDREEEHDDERVERRAEQLRRQKIADLPHLVELLDELAGRTPLEIVDRQIEDLVEGVAPQLDVGAGRDEQHEIAAEVAESRLEQQDDREGDADHREGVEAAVIHDAVDEDAPEHDWRDRRNAQDDRADAEVARHAAVAQQLRQDEAEAEWLVFVAQVVIALHQDDFAVPGLGEAHLVEHQGRMLRRVRVLQYDDRRPPLCLHMDAQQDHGAAVAQQHDRGERRPELDEACPTQAGRLGAQPRAFGDAQQLRRRYLARGELMIADQLRHRQMHAALPRRDDEAAKK